MLTLNADQHEVYAHGLCIRQLTQDGYTVDEYHERLTVRKCHQACPNASTMINIARNNPWT